MMTKTDLHTEATAAITDHLNTMLSDSHVIYTHYHALHWNVEGKQFFVVHRELEGMYEALAETIDELAERILILGHRPVTTLKEYVERSSLDELASRKYSADEVSKIVLADLDHQITAARNLIITAGEHNDEVTADMGVGLLKELEKQRWFWSAFQD